MGKMQDLANRAAHVVHEVKQDAVYIPVNGGTVTEAKKKQNCKLVGEESERGKGPQLVGGGWERGMLVKITQTVVSNN